MSHTLPDELRDAVAIIGISLRFPGASNPAEYWRNLADGVESISFSSKEELLAAGMNAATLDDPRFVPAYGQIEGAALFDPGFFQFTPQEARLTDPQQRLLITCAWEALEDAGYGVAEHEGPVGVFVGAAESTYYDGQDRVSSAGGSLEYLATRISYKLNLKGPSLALQTACSTSLVCAHMASRSLLDGECDLAVVGAASIRMPQSRGHYYQAGGILSPDGHCRPFDAQAQGTVGGNGVAAVVLKRMEDAWEDGDPVRAVILGSAINNDGSDKVGYTAPSVNGQAQVIAEALALARVEADTISYVEAHGTATPLGDPIEVQALHEVFRDASDQKGFCGLGSVKSNFGHLNTAAGMAGLIKTVLALEHQQLPPSLHFETPNPEIQLEDGPFYVNHRLQPWQTEGARRAGVSSFGIGGTNAHLILEEAPPSPAAESSEGPKLLLLSARSETTLEAATQNLATHLQHHPELDLADVAHTLQVGRRIWSHRRMLVCGSLDETVKRLQEPVAPAVRSRQTSPTASPDVVFLFSGQGAQHVGMGRELYQREPVFREEFDRCCELLKPHLQQDLRDLLFPESGDSEEAAARLTDTDIAQPALLAVEYSLAKTWIAKGIEPAALIGHSVGEYATACLAGIFSLEDAMALVAARGRLMHRLPRGGMLAVFRPADEIPERPGLSIAAINADSRTVVSGPMDAIEALEAELGEQQVSVRRLHTSHAFHSEMMEPVIEPFARELAKVELKAPEMPLISNLTGRLLSASEATDPAYWCRQLRDPVRFADGIRHLEDGAQRVYLEIGPGSSLVTFAGEIIGDRDRAVPSLGPPRDPGSDVEHLLSALGRLWLVGVPIDWQQVEEEDVLRRRVPLPTTPFDLRTYRLRRESDEPKRSQPSTERDSSSAGPVRAAAEAAAPPPASALAPPAALPAEASAPASAPPTGGLELILNEQLQLMSHQLELLRRVPVGMQPSAPATPDVALGAAQPTVESTAEDAAVERPEIPEDVAATHRDLSQASYRFLEYVLESPSERGRPINHRDAGTHLEEWIQRASFDLQSWPTFLGHRKRDQIREGALTVISLVRSLYERVFENDPEQIAAFHRFESPQVAEFLTTAPNGLENSLVRCDFTDSLNGFKCLEVNASGSISGWQHLFWEEILRNQPVIADFIEREGIDPKYCDVLEAFLGHVAEDCRRRGLLEGDHLNLAMANERRTISVTRGAMPRLNQLAATRLRKMGMTGTLIVCTMDELEVRGGKIYHGSTRIHAIHQTDFEPTPRDVLFCQKSASVVLYNTPLAFQLGDKRLIALLSEHAESQRFSASERASIHKYIPWTRRLLAGPVTFEGQEADIRELLTREAERFVIKKGLGSGGLDVHIGQHTPLDEWTTHVADAIDEEDWIVQEFLPYRPYFFQGGEMGATLHHAVYGIFCFGDRYGGCFLRTREPGDCGGVINSTRGAIESLVFELKDADDEGPKGGEGEAELESAITATHADLSMASSRFLDDVRARPEMSVAVDYRSAEIAPWLKHFTYELQSWPIFLGADKLEQVRDATRSVTGLLRTVFAKIFDNDPAQIAEFFDLSDEQACEFLLESPNGIASSMARCDFIDTGQGFLCLEVNMSANIGGWQLAFWEQICRSQPAVRDFLGRENLDPVYHDLLETLFEQILEDCQQHGVIRDDRLTVALITEDHKVAAARPAAAVLNERFREWLSQASPELEGQFLIGAFSDDFRVQAGDVRLAADRVNCLLKATQTPIPEDVLIAFKRQRVMLYNTPAAALLSDKRLIALLSEHADSSHFSPEERAAIGRYIPWTRRTGRHAVTFEGRESPLCELLIAEQDRFVLKAAGGAGGEQVYIGRSIPRERWMELVESTASEDWVAQEYLTSRPYLFQRGEHGYAPHDAVWGLFCFGDRYAGGFLRIMLRGEGDGILNAARGATEAFIYQV